MKWYSLKLVAYHLITSYILCDNVGKPNKLLNKDLISTRVRHNNCQIVAILFGS